MVKVAILLLACGVMFVACAGAAPTEPVGAGTEQDGAQRSERSANLSHITGTARKIRMYIKNRILQILPDGVVNGSNDDSSQYSILQRQSVRVGQVKIQGVATCMYLCIDPCGLAYGSREFGEECIFNENIEQHHYNTYSVTKYSNHRRTVYLALNRRGVSRRVQIKAKSPLGKLSTYTNVLTQTVPPEEVEALARRMAGSHGSGITSGAHHLRHHHPLCPPATTRAPDTLTPDLERCRKRKKRRKRRRCREGEDENEECHKAKEEGKKRIMVARKRCEEGEGKEKCQQKKLHMIGRKRKSRHETKRLLRHLQHPRSHTRSEEEDSEEVQDHEDHEHDQDQVHDHEHEDVTAIDDEDATDPSLQTND